MTNGCQVVLEPEPLSAHGRDGTVRASASCPLTQEAHTPFYAYFTADEATKIEPLLNVDRALTNIFHC